jgi:glycosyltransferase involved in cell wall biosynthesis
MTPTDRPLKVCFATWAPFVGGAEVAAERTALGLTAAGQDVFMLVAQAGPVLDRYRKAGLRCVVARMRFTGKWDYPLYWLARRRLIRILTDEKPDLIHGNDLPTHAMVADAARRVGLPRVCHHRFPFPGTAIDWMNKFGAERHVFVSRALMDEMCAASPTLAASARGVLYDGLPLSPVPTAADRLTVRRQLGLPADKVIVLFAGQIIERKGVADLIRAWGLLPAAARAAAELVIVGDDLAGNGAYRAEMEKLAAAESCPAKFVGFQKNVADWLTAADVAVVPSHVEPLGNATLEAMALGLPVIGGDVGGIPEMVAAERTGLLVPPKSPPQLAAALARLIANPAERAAFGAAGAARCRDLFALEPHARNVIETYRQLVPGRPSTPA